MSPVETRSDTGPTINDGSVNRNPEGIGFWALVREDFRTNDASIFHQGFLMLLIHRFGNWRMGQPKLIRAPSTLLYLIMFKLCEVLSGISLWYTVKLGRRVRIWHHSGIVLGNRGIGDDCHIRQNTTIGVVAVLADEGDGFVAPAEIVRDAPTASTTEACLDPLAVVESEG